jgi:DNA-binding MarR family transcriptional regulator
MEYSTKNSFGFRMSFVANKVHAMFSKTLEEYGIAPEQFAMMKIISEENQATHSDIAKLLDKGKPTVSRTIDALEKKGFVFRDEMESDRRVKTLRLTPEGEKVLSEVIPHARAFNDTIREKLSSQDVESFFKVLNVMLETLHKCEINGEMQNGK